MWLFRDCPSFLAGSRMLRTPLAVRSLRIAGEGGVSGFMRRVGFEDVPFRFRAIASLRTELCTKITFFVCRSKYFGHYLLGFRQIAGVAPIRPTPLGETTDAHGDLRLPCASAMQGSERLFPAVGENLLLSSPHGCGAESVRLRTLVGGRERRMAGILPSAAFCAAAGLPINVLLLPAGACRPYLPVRRFVRVRLPKANWGCGSRVAARRQILGIPCHARRRG